MLERHIDKVVTEAKMANPSSKTKEKFRKQERLLLHAHIRKENADNQIQHQPKLPQQHQKRESAETPDGIYEKSKPKPKLILSNGKEVDTAQDADTGQSIN